MNAIETFVKKLIDGGNSYQAIYATIAKHSGLVMRDLLHENWSNLPQLEEIQAKHAKHLLANMPLEMPKY